MSISVKIRRIKELARDGDLAGIVHQSRLSLGLRGLVPAPSRELINELKRSDDQRHRELSAAPLTTAADDQDSASAAVLAFSHNLNREGASISLFELMGALKGRGEFAPTVVAFEDGPLRAEYAAAGIPVTVVASVLGRLSTLRRLDVVLGELVGLIRRFRPDLIVANTLLNFPVVLAAERAGIPSIWIPRESEPWNSYFRFLPDPVAQQAIAAIWLPRRVVFVAHATRKVWDELDCKGNFEVIHNGIKLERFAARGDVVERTRCRSALGLESDAVAVVCIGTFCDRKNQRDLIEALALLPAAIARRVQIFLVGADHGSYAKALRQRSHSLPLSVRNRIQFFPPTESIDRFYAAADIFVLSSKIESFPRVVLEAMAFGLPIISTPVFGVVEQACEGENALFYSPGDAAKLAKHIELLVIDEALRKRMSSSSLQRISHMTTFDEMVDAYASVFRQAIAGATQKAAP